MFFTVTRELLTIDGKIIKPGISLKCLNKYPDFNAFSNAQIPLITTSQGVIDITQINNSKVRFIQNRPVLYLKKNNNYHALISIDSRDNKNSNPSLYDFIDNFKICPRAFDPKFIGISEFWGCTRVQILEYIFDYFNFKKVFNMLNQFDSYWNWLWFQKNKNDFDLWKYNNHTQAFEYDCNLLDIITKVMTSNHLASKNNYYFINTSAQKYIFYNQQNVSMYYFLKNQNLSYNGLNNCSLFHWNEINRDLKNLYNYFYSNDGGMIELENSYFIIGYVGNNAPDLNISMLENSDWVVWKNDYLLAHREVQLALENIINGDKLD